MVAATRITYLIMSGVRRAKAAQMAGQHEIECQVIGRDGISQAIREIPLDDLLSPKTVIEIGKLRDRARWESVLEATRQGKRLPPLEIRVGTRGTALSNVRIALRGDL